MQYQCMIVDDEKLLADSTAEYLNLFGVKTAVAYSAAKCRAFFQEHTAELLLLDINLEDGSGFELCKELRETTDIPILFISARNSDDDKLIALHIGGDDYIEKPYSLSVLLAKVTVMLKRYRQYTKTSGETLASDQDSEQGNCYVSADRRLEVRFDTRQLFVEGAPVKLTALEFKLLAYLIRQENRVVSKRELFDEVWKDRFTGDGTLNVHIRRLREAIERQPGKPEYILTVWGDGYQFCGGKE